MRLRARSLPRVVVALAIAALLLPVPLYAEEPTTPPSSEEGIFTGAEIDTGVGMVFDALVLRPFGLVGLGVGAVFFVPAAALSVLDENAFEEAFEIFLKLPFQNVFTRPLGDF